MCLSVNWGSEVDGEENGKEERENDFCVRQRSSGPYLTIIHQFFYILPLRVLIPSKPCSIP